MRAVSFYASLPHYADHLLPVWEALDRPPFHCRPKLTHHLTGRGVPVAGIRPASGLVVVAGACDVAAMRDRPTVLVEHGAGQAYDVDDPGYSGGPGRDGVVLFLCPNETSATRNRAAYPHAAVEVVGSPRVEALRSVAGTSPDGRGEATGRPPSRQRRADGPPAVALSFHFDSPMGRRVPEAGSALRHYERGLRAAVLAMRERGIEVIGHGHPRGEPTFRNLWRRLGVEHMADFAEVVRFADVYACDNSSTLYEAAAVGIPVVVMNAPWYRRDVDLWPRFWACADVGVQVEAPEYLALGAQLAIADPPAVARRRGECVAEVFPLVEGSARRSADAVLRAAALLQ